MKRRELLKSLLGLLTIIPFAPVQTLGTFAGRRRDILLQSSPVAGFQFYDGEFKWKELLNGTPLRLAREPNNPYDENAVQIYWQDRKLGYLPRAENITVAQMLDRGETITAVLKDKRRSDNPWERLKIEVWLQV